MPGGFTPYGKSRISKPKETVVPTNQHLTSGSWDDIINNFMNQVNKDVGTSAAAGRVAAATRRSAVGSSNAIGAGIGLGSGMQPNAVDQLTQMIQQQGSISGPSPSQIAAQAQAMASGTYDPQIQALIGEQKAAKGRAGAAKKDIGGLFNGLVDYYASKQAPTKAMFTSAKADSKQRTTSLKGEITADYTNRLKEQVDQYKQLGITAAVPSATQEQVGNESNALATADTTGAADQAALDQQATGDQQYWQSGAATSKQEGVEDQTAITTQLNDYLNRSGGQIAGMKAAKAAAYQQGLMQLQQQAASSAQQQQNTLWNHMLDVAKLKQSSASANSSSIPTNGLSGAGAYLSDPNLMNAFQTQLSNGSQWMNTPQAKLMYGGQAPNTPEEMARMIRDGAANAHMSPEDQQKLWQAALIYFGKLK